MDRAPKGFRPGSEAMTYLNGYPQKHNRLSLKVILSIVAFSLIPVLFHFYRGLMANIEKITNPIPDNEKGNYGVEENQAELSMINSTMIIHVAGDDPRYEDRGLGTVIGDHTILTAKHVVGLAIVRNDIPGLRINDLLVSGLIKVRYCYFSEQGETSGTDIMRIDLPLSFSGSLPAPARLASQETMNSVGKGTWVSVVYYDHARSQLGVGKFRVIEIGDGMAKLDDPSKIIVPGDSGGGVYYNGALVGLTTSIDNAVSKIEVGGKTVEHKQYQGEFWITLITPAFR